MKRIFNIDWLQVNAKGILNVLTNYDYKILPYSTRVFGKLTEVSQNGRSICIIASQPLSSIIPAGTNIIKFDNKLLYDFDLWTHFDFIVYNSGLKYKNVTRLDICFDFNYFDCNLTGTKFIENFINNKYYHHSKSNFNTFGRQKKKNIFDYIRFGGAQSPVSCYLYDKTLEMKQKTFKQHIWDCWIKNELDTTKKVYRLEFSIKTNSVELVNGYTGASEKLTVSNLKSSEWLQKLYYTLCKKYFLFSYANALRAKDVLKEVKLFNCLQYYYTHRFFCLTHDITRADKIFLKKLESYNNELRSTRLDLAEDCENIKNNFIDTHGLSEYYNKKVK